MSFELFSQQAQAATPAAGKAISGVESTNRRPYVLDDKGVLNILSSRGLTNVLRNAGMWFAQRQAPGTLTTYSNTTGRAFTADGWAVTNENASIQYIRTDTNAAPETGLQARYYGTYSKITNAGKIVISQMLEGTKTMSLRGRTVRFQVWLKASALKTIKIAVIQLNSSGTIDTLPATFISAFGANGVDPTLGTNLAYLAPKSGVSGDNCTAGANAFSCSVTTSWQRFGGVVDVPTNCKNVLVLIWTDTQFAAADSVSMSQASLTDGYEIQDYSPQDLVTELQYCQRFYCKSFSVDTNPVQNAGLAGSVRGSVAVAGAVAAPDAYIRFPVNMRANPTMTYFNPSAANAFLRNVTAGTDATATATGTAGDTGLDVSATGLAAWTVAQSTAVHYTADAEL